MQLKCSRFVFTYETPPDEVEDFILRSDDLAAQTYGRNKFFSRLNQVLDQARFLGWPLPRFGPNLPEDLTEIPPAGVNHIFENQAKLLVDIAPVTRIMIEDGRYIPVRMVCGTTAAGDLVWKCHLLSDRDGNPYVQKNNERYKAKTKGTKIVCQTDNLPYDETYLFECFGGKEGIWPVPFLPEFFSDRPIAQKFSMEPGVVEVVNIQEEEPVHVFAHEMVPWYRPLEIDRTKALSFDSKLGGEHFSNPQDLQIQEPDGPNGPDVGNLVEGWDDFSEDKKFNLNDDPVDEYAFDDDHDDDHHDDQHNDIDGDAPDTAMLTNIVTSLTSFEYDKLREYDQIISNSNIATKQEAEDLRKDPKHKDRAENWLLAAVNRLRLLANHNEKIGAVVSLAERHRDSQLLIIQPRQKWATKLVEVLNQRGIKAQCFDPKNKSITSKYFEGALRVLVSCQPREELFIEEATIVSVSSFKLLSWLDSVNQTHDIYTISTKQLGYTDYNLVPEHPNLDTEIEEYKGPSLDILQLESSASAKKAAKKKPKFKVKTGKGRPKSAPSYEKALEMAKKLEGKGEKCEIISPDGKDTMYVTGMPKSLQGELN